MTKRRGRKRKLVERFPNGQPRRSRPLVRDDMTKVVREARQRVFHLSATQASAMPETSQLGRLKAMGELSDSQYEAAVEYIDIVHERNRMIGAQPVQSGGNLERLGGYDDSDGSDAAYVRRYHNALHRFLAMERALNDANAVDAKCASVVYAVCMSDWSLPDMTGTLRIGLNYVAKALKRVDKRFTAPVGAKYIHDAV